MNIIITGASRGIGRETAKIFAANKENLIIVISRSKDKLFSLKTECSDKGAGKIIPLVTDLENIKKNEKKIYDFVIKHMRSVDILINNAGFLQNTLFSETSGDTVERTFNINFFAPAQLIKLLLPLMGKEKRSHIINISSMGAVQGSAKYPGLAYYSASKAAIANLTECLAEEYKEHNIAFNCLALGSANTEMFNEAFPGYKAAISAQEMAILISDFAVKGQKYFNGKIIPVSGSTP